MTSGTVSCPRTGAALLPRAVVLLAGRVGRDPFADGVGRPILGLPIDGGRSVLDAWGEQFADFARRLGIPRIDVRVAVNRDGIAPHVPAPERYPGVGFHVECDAAEYRGTAGVVRDLTRSLGGDDLVLVVTAHQILREPLYDVFRALSRGDEGVSLVPHAAGEYAGVLLLRSGRLGNVPDVGFVDMKEQALPSVRGLGQLLVTRRARGAALPLRTREQYIHALRTLHSAHAQDGAVPPPLDPFEETWQSVFTVVELGARVEEGAVLRNSVVLAGGVVETEAVVVDSVVCSGGVVRRGRCVSDSVVAGAVR